MIALRLPAVIVLTCLITGVFGKCFAQNDSTYVLYLNNNSRHTTVKAEDYIKIKTVTSKDSFSKYQVKAINKNTLILDPFLVINPVDILAVKKVDRKNNIVGSSLLGVGLGLSIYGFATLDSFEPNTAAWVGQALLITGIILVTPPVYKSKKKNMIEIVDQNTLPNN